MFTGIIETTGRVLGCSPAAGGRRLHLDLAQLGGAPRPGDSLAVNGVCLTAVDPRHPRCSFDVVPETWRRTALSDLRAGDRVNLERSLAAGARFDGHFVQGHVDAVARIIRVDAGRGEHLVWLEHAPDIAPMIVPKGSVALDGVSLTIAEVRPGRFSVALIPTTLERTTLRAWRPGRRVNLETDLIARAVAHQLALQPGAGPQSAWSELLQRQELS